MREVIRRVLESKLCERGAPIGSAWQAIGWWEARRVPFNLIVGCVGIVTCIIIGVVGLGGHCLFNTDFALPDPPLFAVLMVAFYAFAANVCYTGGWLAELVIRAAWPTQADRYASLSLSLGLLFSVLVTLLPGIVVGVAGVLGLFGHLFGAIHG
jgi:hypothetical protein